MFKARKRGNMVYAGPEFVGPEPNYMAKLDALVKEQGHRVEPGKAYVAEVRHDDDCDVFSGGPCDCNPDVRLVAQPARPA
jgi:hypothetical protein